MSLNYTDPAFHNMYSRMCSSHGSSSVRMSFYDFRGLPAIAVPRPATERIADYFITNRDKQMVEALMRVCMEVVPLNFANYLKIAVHVDRRMFERMQESCRWEFWDQSGVSLMRSPLEDFITRTNYRPFAVARAIKESFSGRFSCLKILTAGSGFSLMQIIRHRLQLSFNMLSNDLPLAVIGSQASLSLVKCLQQLRCSQSFICNVCHVSHTNRIFENFDAPGRQNESKQLRRGSTVAKVREMLMIAMYQLYVTGMRVCMGRDSSDLGIWNAYDIPREISVGVAAGAYNSMNDILQNEPFRSLICGHDNTVNRAFEKYMTAGEVMPHFQSFYHFLTKILSGEMALRCCVRCQAPVLVPRRSQIVTCGIKYILPVCSWCNHEELPAGSSTSRICSETSC